MNYVFQFLYFFFPFSEIKCIIDSFGSHLNVDLQQRSVEFSQLFKTHSNLRPALLEKMPPMQISRVSNQNNDLIDDNESELIQNGLDDNESKNLTTKLPASDSVSAVCNSKITIQYSNNRFFFFNLYFNFKFAECFARFTRWQRWSN